jgi:hypothetical protein
MEQARAEREWQIAHDIEVRLRRERRMSRVLPRRRERAEAKLMQAQARAAERRKADEALRRNGGPTALALSLQEIAKRSAEAWMAEQERRRIAQSVIDQKYARALHLQAVERDPDYATARTMTAVERATFARRRDDPQSSATIAGFSKAMPSASSSLERVRHQRSINAQPTCRG